MPINKKCVKIKSRNNFHCHNSSLIFIIQKLKTLTIINMINK